MVKSPYKVLFENLCRKQYMSVGQTEKEFKRFKSFKGFKKFKSQRKESSRGIRMTEEFQAQASFGRQSLSFENCTTQFPLVIWL